MAELAELPKLDWVCGSIPENLELAKQVFASLLTNQYPDELQAMQTLLVNATLKAIRSSNLAILDYLIVCAMPQFFELGHIVRQMVSWIIAGESINQYVFRTVASAFDKLKITKELMELSITVADSRELSNMQFGRMVNHLFYLTRYDQLQFIRKMEYRYCLICLDWVDEMKTIFALHGDMDIMDYQIISIRSEEMLDLFWPSIIATKFAARVNCSLITPARFHRTFRTRKLLRMSILWDMLHSFFDHSHRDWTLEFLFGLVAVASRGSDCWVLDANHEFWDHYQDLQNLELRTALLSEPKRRWEEFNIQLDELLPVVDLAALVKLYIA